MNKTKRIGISFSGGAARGIAHIGVIKALNEKGIHANEVAGTSAGSIIAALYAAGISTKQMIDMVNEANLFRVIRAGIPVEGFTDLKYLKKLLSKYVTSDKFEDLNLPLYVIASNLLTGKKEILQSGSLSDSVMASCSIPILFKPVKIENKVLVDGGIHDNMPVEPLQQWCDFIIGVNVMPNVPSYRDDVDNLFNIGMRVFDIAISENSRLNFPKCNVIIEPKDIVQYATYQFHAQDELINLGYKETLKMIPIIKSKLNEPLENHDLH